MSAAMVYLIISVVLTVASTAVSMSAAKSQADAQEAMYKRKAQADRAKAGAQISKMRRLRRIKMRRMLEAGGKSGMRTDLGTPLEAAIDTSAQMEMDEISVARTGQYSSESGLAAAANAATAGNLSVAAIGLSGVASASGTAALAYGQMEKPKTTTTTGKP